MKIAVCVLLAVAAFCTPLMADYSSLTSAEREQIVAALNQAWEYRTLLDGAERRSIEEAVNVSGNLWRVRVLLEVPKKDGGTREIRRDVYVTVKATGGGVSWPWLVVSAAAGVVAGVLIAR